MHTQTHVQKVRQLIAQIRHSIMIPFNKGPIVGTELKYVEEAMKTTGLCGNGEFTRRCQEWMENRLGGGKVFMTTSCTSSLEIAAILVDPKPGDEVIVPSYTFVSTINAFVLRGATVVFVDIEEATMNIDHTKIEAAITPKTRAIVPVHYAGVACDMNAIMALAEKYKLLVVEDAAQCVTATYNSKALGSIGHIGCFSFHETKNFTSGGQGGAVVINEPSLVNRAEVVYDNGTNRRQFFRGEVDKYEWIDIGSNFIMSEIQAAYLWAQLEKEQEISDRRHQIWTKYAKALQPIADAGQIRLPPVPKGRAHNAHMFFIKLEDKKKRDEFIRHMKKSGITSSAHYVPLHPRPLGQRQGRFSGKDCFTTSESDKLVRLPIYNTMGDEEQGFVLDTMATFFKPTAKTNGVSSVNGVNGANES